MFRAMEAGKLPVEYYICGDDAYSGCGEQMLCPYAGPNQPFAEDVFNFYQSRTRIAVECAFDELVGRWGILWRPLRHEYGDRYHSVLRPPAQLVHRTPCRHASFRARSVRARKHDHRWWTGRTAT